MRAGAEVVGSSVPTAMPAQPTALLALMKLFWTVDVMVTGPSTCISIAMQSMFRRRFAGRPVVGDVEVALTAVPGDATGEEPVGLVADAGVPAVHGVAGDRDHVRRVAGGARAARRTAGVRVAGPHLHADARAEVGDGVVGPSPG